MIRAAVALSAVINHSIGVQKDGYDVVTALRSER
jgi:hypothetical protein